MPFITRYIYALVTFIEESVIDPSKPVGRRIAPLIFIAFFVTGALKSYNGEVDGVSVVMLPRDQLDRAKSKAITRELEAETTPSRGSGEVSPYFRLKQLESSL